MAYRKFDTGTWQDPWFEDLSTEAKLAFIYLWTNEICNPAGIYEISEKRIQFELGYGIDTVYSELDTKVYWDRYRKIVWVKNFFRWQCQNHKFALSALNSIKDDPFKLNLFINYNRNILEGYATQTDKNGNPLIDLSQYHTDTVSEQYPYSTDTGTPRTEQNRTEAETEAATEGGSRGGSNPNPTPLKKIISAWNEAVDRNKSSMHKIQAINSGTGRHNHVRARWKENPDLDTWEWMAEKATTSDFLNGQTKSRDRPLSFDWIVESAGNFTKVLEGKYDNNATGNGKPPDGGGDGEAKPSKYDGLETDVYV